MRIFKISGNFQQKGEWSNPDPSFEGRFLAEDDGYFIGYMNELRDTPYSKLRFIAGYYSEDEERGGICFYKFANDYGLVPLMYTFPIWAEFGQWAKLSLSTGEMSRQGKAKMAIEEVAYSNEIADAIRTEYAKLDKTVNLNSGIAIQFYCCKYLLENIVKR
jgi:hypothetical protein